jgi:nucleotide-binding universal stress UspA family protein
MNHAIPGSKPSVTHLTEGRFCIERYWIREKDQMTDAASNFLQGKVERILVPIDFSAKSALAIEHAVVAARIYNASIWLVHVLESTIFISGGLPGALQEISARCESALESLAASVREQHIACSVLLRQGDLDQQIEAVIAEQEIGILVLATKAGTAFGGFQIASTAERILRKTTIPVLTVSDCHKLRKWTGNGRLQVFYATDLSPSSIRSLDHARALQHRLPVEITVAHVVSAHASATEVEAASQKLKTLAEGASSKLAILQGRTGPAICKASQSVGADLIVVGVKPHSVLRELLFGHTLLEILSGACCPVLTIRL